MKKYYTEINDSVIKNEVSILEGNKVSLNGNIYDYDHKFINNDTLLLRVNNSNYFLLIAEDEDDNSLDISDDSVNFKVKCKSETDILLEGMAGSKSDGKIKKEIKSPMPGIIKAINVKAGQAVVKGDVLLVLEAMKMENEIKAVIDGVIKKVNAEALSSVEKNELLLEFE
ncbi:MAG: biotin/lipoyl-binding protein [Ignavibacteria bacterium]|nr:biotin/lipoyl-binding protein [Ignavibacteria bacterium]